MEDSERKAYLDIITKLMDVILATSTNHKETERVILTEIRDKIGLGVMKLNRDEQERLK